jgi:hypothetical protein
MRPNEVGDKVDESGRREEKKKRLTRQENITTTR